MPFTLNPYTILGGLLALLIMMLVSLSGGWYIRGWHDDSKQLKKTNSDIAAMHAQFADVVTASNQLTDTISASNKATDGLITGMMQTLGSQNRALSQIQLDIKSIPVGTCSFTPDADGLYQRAYQAAFGAARRQDPAAGKTDRRDVPNSAAAAARTNQ